MSRADRVWKYPLPQPGTIADVKWPAGAEVLHVAMQHGALHAWLRVDPGAQQQRVSLATVGTGHPFPASAEHIGTILDGPWVWHVFAVRALQADEATEVER